MAVLMAFLIIMPVLLLAMTGASGMFTAVYTADVDAQEAAAFAAKAAASQVEPTAQAAGFLYIHAQRAHDSFRNVLAANTGLDPLTMQPLQGSPYWSIKYWLLVYNGTDAYSAYGAPGAKLYRYDGSVVTESNFTYAGFPASFSISDGGIVWGGGGGVRSVTLETPGAVVLLEVSAKRVLGQGTVDSKRWAAARVVKTS